MLRRIGVLASLAVLATMFAGISTANAQSAGACVFTGVAGQLEPDLPAIAGDLTPDIEQGSYHFDGDATCAGLLDGVLFTPGVTPNATIVSDGFYDNLYCSTGLAHDTNGAGTTLSDGTNTVDDVGYVIPFAAGTGPLLIGAGTIPNVAAANLGSHADGGSGSGSHGAITGAFAGAGAVNILPAAGGNCVTTDVGEFAVTGGFVAAGL
jgi:hypothetical protein